MNLIMDFFQPQAYGMMFHFIFGQEKTGGKIIYSRGGVIFLFRGRNYNYRSRPRYPLMLWKPVTPVYPRLVQRAPEGLTLEEATEMRKKGRQMPPICKLGKNGVYSNLVKNVREAFDACELVRIDCKDMNSSDCRKIGAKLKDLVPCVLISFEFEHILMWRGKDWKSSLHSSEDDQNKTAEVIADDFTTSFSTSDLKGEESMELLSEKSSNKELISVLSHENMMLTESACKENLDASNREPLAESPIVTSEATVSGIGNDPAEDLGPCECISVNRSSNLEEVKVLSHPLHLRSNPEEKMMSADGFSGNGPARPKSKCLDGLMHLLRGAVESGSAVILDDEQLDANIVYERSVALAKSAPAGPVFPHRIRKVTYERAKQERGDNHEEQDLVVEPITISETRSIVKNSRSKKREDFKETFSEVLPHGSLRVDELAKLLA